ncbi:PepSY-associated TM helix domain-containing protein [Sphingomonas sp. BGYR3]|uniref:PepSY-associated TM helix domain-containing protein n=1 Tax=Sphingomonas sp. BGYR3 TaxID=2975483 RepID=UPI0021A91D32|nr:PepSY-associated TM helix domain-containing protein [Sphingomonas sp. BGYR3]MDG5487786.1 PepSY-associated TM helix domain-containing protein [Sphingomonas sp. BGYR3]
MTDAANATLVKRGLSAHAAIGLLAGALLYLVCLSGTVLVFYEEWQRAEQGAAPEMTTIDPVAVQRGVQAVLESERGKPATTHLYVHLPVPELPRTTITTDSQAVHLDAQGRIAVPEENGWSEFLYALHYTLHLPSLVGMTIVGILGVLMLALSISGVIAHPRIFRDAFRLRMRHGGGLALADWHNRLSVWTLPFGIAIAITGAAIGLASVTAYAVAARYYDGDIEAVYAPIFGEEAKPDPRPAPVPDVAVALRTMSDRFPDVAVTYAILHDPMTAGQHVQIVASPARRLIFGEYYAFDAAGRFMGTAGLADGDIGKQAAASNYNLHFGNFGGLPVKVAYCLFGLALTIVSATGVYIWLGKRQRRGIREPGLLGAWHGVVWGAPAALILTLAARFAIGNAAPFIAIFWTVLIVTIVACAVRWVSMDRSNMKLRQEPSRLTAA